MLPRISDRECVKALESVGFQVKRQKGSHIVLRRDDPFAQWLCPTIGSLTVALCEASSGTPG